jgi:acyl-CoA synthetase (AMP-forming)/AMP-acid ligase II
VAWIRVRIAQFWGRWHAARAVGRDTGNVVGEQRADFFISHAGSDLAWAEWVAWQLAEAGYTVELDAWDWPAGANFVTAMSDARDRCDRVVTDSRPPKPTNRDRQKHRWRDSYVEFVSELPKTPTGKVRKAILRSVPAGATRWDRETQDETTTGGK